MRSLPLLLFATVFVGCAGTAPPMTPLPVPTVERAAPPPEAEPVAVEVETVQAPVVPPPTPERRIARRSVYEGAQATEWVLENDLTVIYVQRPGEGYHARLVAPTGWMGLPAAERPAFAHIGEARWGPLTGRLGPGDRVATGPAESLGELVDAVRAVFTAAPDEVARFDGTASSSPRWGVILPADREDHGARQLAQAFGQPEAFTVVLVGPIGAEWVEPVVAERLFMRRGGGPSFGTADPSGSGNGIARDAASGVVGEWDLAGGWDDLPTLLLLDAMLADRVGAGQHADVTFDAARGMIRLRVASTRGGAPDLRAPFSAAEVDAARRRASAAAASDAGLARAFADLWALPGRYRPARRPDDAVSLPAAIARTPSGQVDDLLRRLLASPQTSEWAILNPSAQTP